MNTNKHRRNRSGNIIILTATTMVLSFALLAMAVDLGFLEVVRTEMQRSTDAAAIAAAWDLIDDGVQAGTEDPSDMISKATLTAIRFGQENEVAKATPTLTADDVTVGRLPDPFHVHSTMVFDEPRLYNAVRVRMHRYRSAGTAVPTFFARVLGVDSDEQVMEATAALLSNFGGFSSPGTDGGCLDLLPFALDKSTWDGLMGGAGNDDYAYNEATGQVTAGHDGVREVNLYPQGTGSPGNRGTVDIGPSNNSTSDIARQILYGISAQDLVDLGKPLVFDENGELTLNGDPGISAGVKDELDTIKGQPRIIPIFSDVSGNGNNAMYTIVQFAGIRIMNVKLTGSMSSKRLIIQPAKVFARYGVPATGDQQKSYFMYTAATLVK